MENFEINRDEFNTTLKEIENTEKFWHNKFPNDYKDFLLKYNGGQIYPNIPSIKATTSSDFWELWGIERFLSVGDIILQKQYPMGYTWNEQHETAVLQKYNINIDLLLAIAIAERGVYYINLDKNQFGQIYFACYQDWDGFVKLETNSFKEFLNSLKPYPDESFVHSFSKTKKIYDVRFFQTPTNPELGLNRFKEILSFLGDANSKSTPSDWTVLQHYAYSWGPNEMDKRILHFLLENGGKTEGLLNKTRDIETIKLLIKKYNVNINQDFNGRYPLFMYTGWGSDFEVKQNYELLDKLLQLNLNIDYSITDDQNRNFIQRLKLLFERYEINKSKSLERWKNHPHMHTYITSETINKMIAEK